MFNNSCKPICKILLFQIYTRNLYSPRTFPLSRKLGVTFTSAILVSVRFLFKIFAGKFHEKVIFKRKYEPTINIKPKLIKLRFWLVQIKFFRYFSLYFHFWYKDVKKGFYCWQREKLIFFLKQMLKIFNNIFQSIFEIIYYNFRIMHV